MDRIKTYKNIDQAYYDEILKYRSDDKDFYVLRFDTVTTYYNNEIVFKTYEEALEEFNNTNPDYKEERVELIFSPELEDVTFDDNEMLMYKLMEE